MPGPTACLRCGTTLPGSGAQVCPSCGRFHDEERGRLARSRRGRVPGGVAVAGVAIVVGLLVAGAVAVAVVAGGSGDSPGAADAAAVETELSPTSGDLIVLPGPLDADAEVVAMASVVGAGRRVIARTSLADEATWQADVVPDEVYSARFALTDDLVLASLGRDVVALDLDDGQVRWRAEASDEVDPSCPSCFAVVGDALVALGRDGDVTAFALTDGEVLWQHHFASPAGRVIPLDDTVVLVDDPPADTPGASLQLTVVDAADGRVRHRILPACEVDDGFGGTTTVDATPSDYGVAIPGTSDVLLAFGLWAGCVQRWSTETGENVWSRSTPTRLDWFGSTNGSVVMDDRRAAFLGYDAWVVVGLAEGGLRAIPHGEDVGPGLSAVVTPDALVTAVSTTRGTAEWSVVGHDLRSGERLWEVPLGGDDDLEPLPVAPHRSTATVGSGWGDSFALATTEDGTPVVLRVGTAANRIHVDAIGSGGTLDRRGTGPIRTDSTSSVTARVAELRDGRALVEADGVLHVVDLDTGEVLATWGR